MAKQKVINQPSAQLVSLLKAAAEARVRVEQLDAAGSLYVFKKNQREYFVRDQVAEINSLVASQVVNNKMLTKKILNKFDLPTPVAFRLKSFKEARNLLAEGRLMYPVVIKPVDGSQGAAVTVNIKSDGHLKKAIGAVFVYNRVNKGKAGSFMIEEFYPGKDYRFLVLDQKVLTAIRREPAYVIGDGRHSVKELIKKFNSQPGIGANQPCCPINTTDLEFRSFVKNNKIKLISRPRRGRKIILRQNGNISTGGRAFECLAKAHPGYKRLARRLAGIFHLRFCAIDLIARDIRQFRDYTILEMTQSPGYDIHECPAGGKAVAISPRLIKALFN